jgi:hypothetical protein
MSPKPRRPANPPQTSRPAGPPVYRPGAAAPATRVHQRANAAQAKPMQPPAHPGPQRAAQGPPVAQRKALETRPAPPVYRPAPAAQRTVANAKAPASPERTVTPANAQPARAAAPPVYRPVPQRPGAAQRLRVPAATGRAPLPMRRASVPRPAAPPTPGRGHVLQRLVLTVGPVDDVIARSVQRLGRAFGGGSALENHASLADLPLDEDLILDAHGASFEEDDVPEFAALFGHRRAEALADSLMAKGFPAGYRAVIYLNGCNTTTQNSGQSYALRFQMAMALRGRPVRVKGNSGSSQVLEHGATAVVPSTREGRDAHREFSTLVGSGQKLVTATTSLFGDVSARGFASSEEADLIRESQMAMELLGMVTKLVKPSVYLEDREDLSPTLDVPGGLHYQTADYTYQAIPPDKHTTLASRIITALDTYDGRFFKWRSSNSKSARDVLRLLATGGHYQKLYVALKWYLTTAPAPPASFVAVGPKLEAGELKTTLAAAFHAWQTGA